MANNRLDTVIAALVASARETLIEQRVTVEEYREAIAYLVKVAEAGELPLFCDVWFEAGIRGSVNKAVTEGVSQADMEGPFYFPDHPRLAGGKMKTLDLPGSRPMLVRGTVKNERGDPLESAKVDVWTSTPDGRYGGIAPEVPADHYRVLVDTDANGRFQVEGTVPAAYQIPDQGPTGHLLEMMGRHSWRPAHVHVKVRHPEAEEFTTQLYFAECKWLRSDCCEGIVPEEFIFEDREEGGKRLLEPQITVQSVREDVAA